jgi:hypothetical protein
MGAITGTVAKRTEMSGDWKLLCLTATVAATSDTITLTPAAHGVSEIGAIIGCVVTGGLDAAFTTVQASYSGLVITVVSLEQDGTAATDFTGTTIAVTVLAR